jgi:hypothetical protein
MGPGWQAEVRRDGRRPVYKTFPTREEAVAYAEQVEEEFRLDQMLKSALANHYSGIAAVWQLARGELQSAHQGEPTAEQIADFIANDQRLLRLACLSAVRSPETPEHATAPEDAATVLWYLGQLAERREAVSGIGKDQAAGAEEDDAARGAGDAA